MTIPSYLSSEMHLQKFSDQTEFQSCIVNFRAEVYAKAKNLALVLQWIQLAEGPQQSKINYWKRFLSFEEFDLMMAAELKWCYDIFYLIYEITERGVVTKGKGQKSYNERKTEECFQRKTVGSCS